jgi:hypothetical protein
MEMAIVLFVLLIAGPLALLYGPDSRRYDERDRRTWWPGTPRR